MALTDKIKAGPPQNPTGIPCSIGALLDRLDGAELDALNAMLYELNWNATQIYETLRDEGYLVGRQSVNRHRGKRCRCFKDAA